MKWFVSRQSYWGVEPEDQYLVEIAQGGCDYAIPDMLVEKYDGEGEEYTDPREAVKSAIEIAKQWSNDAPELTVNIGHGSTGGMTIPFEGDGPEELIKWANKRWETLPKCDRCGDILPEEHFILEDEKFCREYCCEERSRELIEDLDDE